MTSSRIASTRIEYQEDVEEYVVKAFDENGKRIPDADYYTPYKDDAKGTAEAMVHEYHKAQQFDTYIKHINENLPKDWYIHIYAGSGSFTAFLVDPDGNDMEISEELMPKPGEAIRYLLLTAKESAK